MEHNPKSFYRISIGDMVTVYVSNPERRATELQAMGIAPLAIYQIDAAPDWMALATAFLSANQTAIPHLIPHLNCYGAYIGGDPKTYWIYDEKQGKAQEDSETSTTPPQP